ncbi:ABC transporter ATP-binding protein [Amycolatopsis suaedae]|uniref:ABC transporter ATP-binding protein n=1 Tax=Amycolatopsis suaedae TaxID=2510978 RepID=A0A4Q7JAS6_9PSEU|nr:ABC transporter ATP-binding protein [Amycolatopsis suaedae]RZQ64158.1 ABC transporter ATP-binding protein [Amycolatopsis suaedae]
MTAIEVRGLRYSYGEFAAVSGVDFTVRSGEILALLGTNGAGKTTTLEMVQGFRRPDGGSVSVLGHDPFRSRTAVKPRVGVMLQEAGLVAELTVAETVRLWAGLSSRRDDVDDVLDRVELSHRAGVAVEKLSGGERRRLDFALATWGRPEVVILDEPTTGLDPESRQRMWKVIAGLRDAGRTILLTTHYLEEAEALADRVAIMHEGAISVAGTLDEVLGAHPARITARVPAELAGSLPPLRGSVSVTGGTDVLVQTVELQSDLSDLLRWAESAGVRLGGLTASQASLHEIFLAIGADR